MIRVPKIFVVVLGAVSLYAAAAASPAAAQTQGKLTSDGPVTFEMTETGSEGANAWTMFTNRTECEGGLYTGHKVNSTPHQMLESGSTEFTLTPNFGAAVCSTLENGEVERPETIDMNGCDFKVAIGQTTGAEGTYGATTDVVCPVGVAGIQLTLFTSTAHTFKICTMLIKPQSLTGGHVTATPASDDFGINGAFTGAHISRSGLCGAGTTTAGQFHIDLTVQGKNAEGAPTGVTVTD